MGRMVVLAEADRAQDRLSAAQIEAIVEGTDEVLEVIAEDALDGDLPAPATADVAAREAHVLFKCVGGRGQIDDAAASVVAFALRQARKFSVDAIAVRGDLSRIGAKIGSDVEILFFGFSNGGHTLIQLSIRHPEMIDKLVRMISTGRSRLSS